MAVKPPNKGLFMISAVAQKYNIHPQTLRLYEREGLLKPSRTNGNTRLYSEGDLEQLEMILSLTRELGVNLAGVEMILNLVIGVLGVQKLVEELLGTTAGSKTLLQEQLKRIMMYETNDKHNYKPNINI